MRILFNQKGDFKNIEKYLKKAINLKQKYRSILEKYGQRGVSALTAATPVDTGTTAACWDYEIIQNDDYSVSLCFNNYNINKGVNIAIILQYGHATRNGTWVEGRDYINPALRPIFDKMADEVWEEVVRL